MTTEIEQIKKHVKSAIDHNESLQLAKEKATNDLHLPYNNGMFYITPALFAFVSTITAPELVLEDIYGNPILVNTTEFKQKAEECYHKAMNGWLATYAEIKKTRKI